jgi:hypothetical protein
LRESTIVLHGFDLGTYKRDAVVGEVHCRLRVTRQHGVVGGSVLTNGGLQFGGALAADVREAVQSRIAER